ncbi:MAG: hypothetical protein ABI644_06530 [Arenimonas sp.]
MNFILKAFRECAYALGVLIVAIIVGQILFMAFRDFVAPPGIDRSNDAAIGFGVLFGLIVLIIHIIRRLLRRKKKTTSDNG